MVTGVDWLLYLPLDLTDDRIVEKKNLLLGMWLLSLPQLKIPRRECERLLYLVERELEELEGLRERSVVESKRVGLLRRVIPELEVKCAEALLEDDCARRKYAEMLEALAGLDIPPGDRPGVKKVLALTALRRCWRSVDSEDVYLKPRELNRVVSKYLAGRGLYEPASKYRTIEYYLGEAVECAERYGGLRRGEAWDILDASKKFLSRLSEDDISKILGSGSPKALAAAIVYSHAKEKLEKALGGQAYVVIADCMGLTPPTIRKYLKKLAQVEKR